MKRILTLFSAFLIAISLCGNSVEAKTQTKTVNKSMDEMEVHFIDVGQGDATLIKCGDGAMLIDAGENDKGTLVQNYIRKQGVKTLDYLIITHADSDHCGGADVIITKYDIDTIIYPNYEKDTETWRDVTEAMDYQDYEVTEPVVGDSYRLGDATFTIIAPNEKKYDEGNNYSVGILLEHGDKKFVFTGDAEEDAEEDIVDNKIDISADVLKIGHHGSRTASTEAFIEEVSPQYAVISCGEDNEYGHPHAQTLNTLRKNMIDVFRTDEQGSIVATSDGVEITWNAAPSDTWKAGEPTKSSNINNKATSKASAANDSKASAKPETKTETKENQSQAAETSQTEPAQVTETPQTEPAQMVEAPQAEPAQVVEAPQPAPAEEAPKQEAAPAVEEPAPQAQPESQGLTYVLNVKTKKFHRPSCNSLPTTNRSDSTQSRDEIIGQGYVPCKRCDP